MKQLLNLCLIVSSLFGYLEWGHNMHSFLFQVEYVLILKGKGTPDSFLHPLVLLPLVGQLLLLFTLFQKTPSRLLTYLGLTGLSLIMLMVLVVGVLSRNLGIICSALPFIMVAIFVLKANRKKTITS
jgi:hypothetical protein